MKTDTSAVSSGPQPKRPSGRINLTIDTAAAAFEAWERLYRADPSKFLTEDEQRAMDTASHGEACAIYFFALVRAVG